MQKFFIGFGVVVIIGVAVFFSFTPVGRSIVNSWNFSLEKVDEETYKKQKEVEDTCRAMIVSYKNDKLIYEQYRDSSNEEERSWASCARIRANQTANTYNEYILKNSFIWQNNIPDDISINLPII